MTNHADVVAKLVAAGLPADQAEEVAAELVPTDPVRDYARSLFAAHAPVTVEIPSPATPGHTPSEGGNPSSRDRTNDDLRAFTKNLFGLED